MRTSGGNGIARRTMLFILASLLAFSACSTTARYRVLSFFLDGVPSPGAKSAQQTGQPSQQVARAGPLDTPQKARRQYAHPPYRDNRCGGCHSVDTGQLVRSLGDGLCLTCHGGVLRGMRFQHGPAAVNDCTACHHHHTAPFPKLLLHEGSETCFTCHDREDLTEADHHADIARQGCVECHNPHGGADRFFLKAKRDAR